MRLKLFPFLLALLLWAPNLRAQLADFSAGRVPMTDLAGPWRFHTGDDPAWAVPGFDDSGWSLLMAGKPWSEQGYRGYTGVGWYRLSVVLPDHPGPLAVFLPDVQESCQIFANGVEIGQIGEMPPHPRYVVDIFRMFSIPESAVVPGRPVVLAIRVWSWRVTGYPRGGLDSIPRIGDQGSIAQWRQLRQHDVFWQQGVVVIDLYSDLLTALAGLALFLLHRKEREYLYWGVSQLFWALFVAAGMTLRFHPISLVAYYAWLLTAYAIASYFQVEFFASFLRQRRRGLFWSACAFIALSTFFNTWSVVAPAHSLGGLLFKYSSMLMQLCLVGMLWRGARAGVPDAAFLLIPNCIMLAFHVMNGVASFPAWSADAWASWTLGFLNQTVQWPFPIQSFDMAGDFEMFAVLVILVRRFARSRRDEERMEAELEAARSVQQVLIPAETPTVPGFAVEAVYRPASQVGGDFFQIIPLAGSGAVIAIGDVSGKGMPAAMTVSLLVGTLRTLVHYTRQPGEILAAMNQRMLARSHGGFTTCLVIRLDPDGTMVAANAGHIPPYVGGREARVESGLPLGLDADAVYPETVLKLDDCEALTALTDGVVEARNARGELFGFERAVAISTRSAGEIAGSAQAFGQEDDITVLSLRRNGMSPC